MTQVCRCEDRSHVRVAVARDSWSLGGFLTGVSSERIVDVGSCDAHPAMSRTAVEP